MRLPWQRRKAKDSQDSTATTSRKSRRPRKFFPSMEILEQREVLSTMVTINVVDNADIGGLPIATVGHPNTFQGTLRQAINEANLNAANTTYVINLQPSIYVIATPSGGAHPGDSNAVGSAFAIKATDPVTINGANTASGGASIIDGNGPNTQDRVFDIGRRANVTFTAPQPGGLVIEDGATAGDGGGLRTAPGSIVKLTNVIIDNNQAAGNGGGIAAGFAGFSGGASGGTGGSLTLTNCVVADNGGGVNVTFNALSGGSGGGFSGGTVNGFGTEGGGIAVTSEALALHGVVVSRNTIGGSGTFSGGSLAGKGGGVYVDDAAGVFKVGTNVTIDKASVISANKALTNFSGGSGGGSGGGVYINRKDAALISGSTIGDPSGGSGGGGNFAEAGEEGFGDPGTGGGIFATGGGSLTLDKTNVQFNGAGFFSGGSSFFSGGGQGGGIFVRNETLQVQNNSEIGQNVAGGGFFSGGAGGGIFAESSVVKLTNSGVIENAGFFGFSGGSQGGGIFAHNSTLKVTNTDFFENAALFGISGGSGQGGALFLSHTNAQITGGTVDTNVAVGDFSGGSHAQGGGIFLDGSGSTLGVSGGAVITNNEVGPASGGGLGGQGGGIYLGSGDTVILKNATVKNNHAIAGDFSPGQGGGIFDDGGILRLTNATIGGSHTVTSGGSSTVVSDGNTADGNGDAVGQGGGIFAQNVPTVSGGAGLTITNSSISYNLAGQNNFSGGSGSGGGQGGGLALFGGRAAIYGSTFDHNQAFAPNADTGVAQGGGIYTGGVPSGGANLSITNSTISDNEAFDGGEGGLGGGLYATGEDTIKLLNDTIAFNKAGLASIVGATDGIHRNGSGGGSISVENTIIAKNTYVNDATIEGDVSGVFVSLGHNLIGLAAKSNGFTNGVLGDQVSSDPAHPLDPGLDPNLANNGGPTKTHALLPGSRARNRADQNAPVTDQRGVVRRNANNPIPDIGAYEVFVAPPPGTPIWLQ